MRVIKNIQVNVEVDENDLWTLIDRCNDASTVIHCALKVIRKLREMKDLPDKSDYDQTVLFFQEKNNTHMLSVIKIIDESFDQIYPRRHDEHKA